jgi:signal transduction histidine kinase
MKLRNIDHTIQLRVRDDGRGFDFAKIERGVERERLGLSGMRERAFAVGGQFEIKSAPGEGTEIIARFPISSASERR